MAGSIKLAPLLTEIKVDIENFKNDMEKASAIGTSEAKRISKVMETTAKVGKNFSKAGDLLTKGLTLPIVGVGAATTKMSFLMQVAKRRWRWMNFQKLSILQSLREWIKKKRSSSRRMR